MTGVVAVTGATGFVGGYIAQRLSDSGWTVRALTRRQGAIDHIAGAIPVVGALDDPPSLLTLVEGADAIVHCAGLIRGTAAAAFEAVNVAGTANLADAAALQGGVTRFILISSLAAREPWISPYAASKNRAELALADRPGIAAWTALRPPTIYGPGDQATLLLFRQIRRGLAFLPRTDGARISMIHVEDLATAVAAMLGAEMRSGAIFDIHDGSEDGYSWDTIIDTAARVLARKVLRVPVPRKGMELAAAANSAYCLLTKRAPLITPDKVRELYHGDWVCHDNSLIDHISWRPTMPISEGFRHTVAWYREAGWL
ncbi:MAG: NAD-dependent epimerase/dehydratase family protein [Alphaproteobacteria bacterium]|nr:NAD-dependent epimerase/dehydratase family protein [Alphaproteobacteria bacterium]